MGTVLGFVMSLVLISLIVFATLAPDHSPLANAVRVDRIAVDKSEHTLTLLSGIDTIRSYHVAIGRGPTGAKGREGDLKIPEGRYIIDQRIPNSQYSRALHISHPGPEDLSRAKAAGVSPGRDIVIHGLLKSSS